jgi:hypothetical protein
MKLDGYSNSDAVAFDFQMIITTISIWRLHAYYTRIYIIYIYHIYIHITLYKLYVYIVYSIYICVCCLITLTLSHVSHPTCLPISGISERITGRTKAVLGSLDDFFEAAGLQPVLAASRHARLGLLEPYLLGPEAGPGWCKNASFIIYMYNYVYIFYLIMFYLFIYLSICLLNCWFFIYLFIYFIDLFICVWFWDLLL